MGRESDHQNALKGEDVRPGFGWLWTATGAANLGDGVTLVAVPVVAVGIGASPAQVAVVSASTTLAWPVLGLPAGWLADRVERRRLLLLANGARVLVLAAGALAASYGALSVPLLVAIAIGYGAAETLVDTTLMGLVPAYAAVPDRTRAHARIEGTVNLTNQLIGPPLSGILVGLGFAAAFGAGAALYLGAALAGVGLLLPRSAPDAAAQYRAANAECSILSGMRLIWSSPTLRELTLLTAAMNLVWGCFTALFVVHALSPQGLDLSPLGYGLVLAAMAVGGIAASAATDRLRRWCGARILLLFDCVGTVLLVAPTALHLGTVLTIAGAVVAGAGSSIWRILVSSIRVWASPDHLLGRIYAASRVVSWGTLPAGALLAGALASRTSMTTAFAASTVFALVVCLWFLLAARRLDLQSAFSPAPGQPASTKDASSNPRADTGQRQHAALALPRHEARE